ncbi:serine/threonine-protein phosphatase [Trifolium pratense]|uniref:Serine/threonine-protein phosphatase n=1 Tax=Trifolium pratense TaxID=57577 RepID=A0A2K3MSB8_TRIPR|nr:serine/threonine-protein phosphatase [Trifolium pratense]
MTMIHQQSSEDTIMEVREDFMTSPAGDSKPTFRTAHFLKPIANSIQEPPFNLNTSSSCSVFEPKERSLKIHFNGWRYPHTKWVTWVDQVKPKYESVWKKAGIFEAIMSTKSHIIKNQDLVYGVVEKWCSETNTFVFPFGEATITLEDIMVLGGYPPFGNPVFTSLENEEMREVEQKLIIAIQERTVNRLVPSTSMWMDTFIGRGSEIEHEAFLATWLSIFVFPHIYDVVKSSLFPIAVCLARGNPIALAPAVLASLYKDLSMFKKTIVDLKKCPDKFHLVLDINLQSPFHLVQVWVWERFKNLQPQPNSIKNGDHVLFKWHNVKPLKIENVRFELDSAIDDFLWRPYVRYADKCRVFYPNDEIVVPFKKELMDEQMLSFVICLRVSELVGFESIEQYLPHRVAMQFGLDQDLPGYVSRFNATKDIAWKTYSRPFSDSDKSLYFPSRFFEADVTTRYANWWEKSVSRPQGFVKNVVPQKRSATTSSKCRPHSKIPHPIPKLVGCTVTIGKSCGYGSKTSKGYNNTVSDDVPSNFLPKLSKTRLSENYVQDCLKAGENIDAGASSSLPPKQNTLTPSIYVENCKHVLEDGNESKEAWLSSDIICESGTQEGRYTDLCEVIVEELEERVSRLERVHRELKKARLGLN